MKTDMRLSTLVKGNPTIADRIKIVAKEIEKDQSKIASIADAYNNKYKKEILEGTAKKQLLLVEGKK